MNKTKINAKTMNFAKQRDNLLFNENKKIIIDWSAKAGCTNIAIMFFKYIDLYKNFNLKNSIDIHHERIEYLKKNMATDNIILDNKYLKIKFVRNPYTRAISSYIHYVVFYNNKSISFFDYLNNLNNNKYNYDIHYASQHHLLEIKQKIYNEIIKIENIHSEIERINKKYNIKLDYDSLSNHHSIKKIDEKKYVGYIKYSDIKNIPSYRYFYDDERIKQLVYEIYKIDINLYNYTFEEFLKLN
jgi:hypothetical protein